MPVLILLAGASLMTISEFLLQVSHMREVLTLFVFLGVVTGGGIVFSARVLWEWWK